MRCPCCRKIMRKEYHKVQQFADWFCDDDEWNGYREWDTYECDDCKITYDDDDDKWILPDTLKPTEKQTKYADWIAEYVDEPLNPNKIVTKQQYFDYIHRNKDEFEEKKKKEEEALEHDELYNAMMDEEWFEIAESLGITEFDVPCGY